MNLQQYTKKTGKNILLSRGGATKGIREVAAGRADIGGSCRLSRPDLTDFEKGVVMTLVAWDAFVAMDHPNNSVQSLTVDQLFKIIKGRTRN